MPEFNDKQHFSYRPKHKQSQWRWHPLLWAVWNLLVPDMWHKKQDLSILTVVTSSLCFNNVKSESKTKMNGEF